MKKLTGMKKNFSSLENKKIKRNELKSINGSLLALRDYSIESNVAPAGCVESDHYTSNGGEYIGRLTVC
ncbi:TIGR04139 family peptide modification target [Chryseobacterium sp. W4I1]|uniref:TIGR04139 family peptide modification target n=1 Tax=Chryseobacterium sp. W4I1 TaxID=3042293 RepID=UPI002784E7EC|nr:TIGR04139 family peptide modification target [Chryseobacterium sp. W4I1]MDQ0784483.1 putative peptide modification target (TIGR04139 family) [Chryseobacterium sp. W4I1]